MNIPFLNLFWIISGIWLLLGIIDSFRFHSLINDLISILTKPIVSVKDENPNNVRYYPKQILESVAFFMQAKFGKMLGLGVSLLVDVLYRILLVIILIFLHFLLAPIELFQLFLRLGYGLKDKDENPKGRKQKRKQHSFKLAIESPKLLSKRFSSPFRVVIYSSTAHEELEKILVQGSRNINILSYPEISDLKAGTFVVIDLSSQEIEFTKSVIKELVNGINIALFTGKPKDACYPGMHSVKLSVTNKENGHEYISQILEVKVVDFAFDHISRPFLSGLISIILGLGSFVTYALTFLGKVDQVFGLTSGTATALIATIIYGRLFDLYRRTKETTNIME